MIRSLHHVGLTVPDLEVGRKFYELAGLDSRSVGNDLVFRCDQRAQDQVRLIEGPRKKLSYVGFGTDEKGMKATLVNLERAGVRLARSPFGDAPGIWFQDPDGDWANIQIAEAAPSLATPGPGVNTPGSYRRVATRGAGLQSLEMKQARPRRLGHLIKFSPDVPRIADFYTQVLGMKVSDRVGDVLAFLRGSAGGDHHLLAFGKSSHTGLHHLSFEVGSIAEMEIGARALLQASYPDCLGPGQHLLGSNFFHYVRDPWGSLIEYFWDIDVIPEDDTEWQASNVDPEVFRDVWSTTPSPPEFPLNFEAP